MNAWCLFVKETSKARADEHATHLEMISGWSPGGHKVPLSQMMSDDLIY